MNSNSDTNTATNENILNDPNINIQWYSSRLLEGILEGSSIARELATKIMISTSDINIINNNNNEENDDENETIIMYLYESLSKALKLSLPLKLIVYIYILYIILCYIKIINE